MESTITESIIWIAGMIGIISWGLFAFLRSIEGMIKVHLNGLGRISVDLQIIREKMSNQKNFLDHNLNEIPRKLQALDNLHKLYQLDKLEELSKLDLLDKLDILVEYKEKELLVNFTYDSVKNRDSLNFEDNYYSPSNQKHRQLVERMDNIERLLKEIATK